MDSVYSWSDPINNKYIGDDIAAPDGPAGYEVATNVGESADVAASSPTGESDTPVQPPPPHSFGFNGSSQSGGVVSHSELLIWLEQYTDQMSAQQRELMMGVEERNKLIEDLTFLSGQIQEGGSKDGTCAWVEQSQADAEALLKAYEGTPYYDQLAKALDGIINNGDNFYSRDEVTSITGDIQGVIDGLQKNDQIAMIELQDIVSNMGKNVQSVSQVIAAENQTILAIIGNIA